MASENQSHNCLLCGKSPLTGRRKIGSVESRNVYNELKSVAECSMIPQTPDKTFPDHDKDGFLCGKCFQSIEKLIKTRANLKHLEDDIAKKVAAKLLAASDIGDIGELKLHAESICMEYYTSPSSIPIQ